MFIRLSTQTKNGDIESRIVAVQDISVVKPAAQGALPAKTCITLLSQPDFPIWAIEDIEAIEDVMKNLGVIQAPRSRK